jgi:hypothetical protein
MGKENYYFINGAIAGLVSDAIVHPIDTIRATLQVQRSSHTVSASTALMNMVRQDGIKRLYKGFGSVFVGTIPGHALYFSGYEFFKKMFLSEKSVQENKTVRIVGHLAAGFFADICGSLVWTPMDVVKQRLQVQDKSNMLYSSSFDAFKSIIKSDGPAGLYRGFLLALMTYGPYVSIYFALYEEWKIIIKNNDIFHHTGDRDLTFFMNLFGAGGCGAISAALTNPLDVIKTRIQVEKSKTSALLVAKKTLKVEGFKAFFKGVKPRALWMGSGTAITMVVYEELKKFSMR